MSTHYIMYPKHCYNKKLIDDDPFQKSCIRSEKIAIKPHSHLQTGKPNFTTF